MPRYPGVTADKLRRERSLITALLVGAVPQHLESTSMNFKPAPWRYTPDLSRVGNCTVCANQDAWRKADDAFGGKVRVSEQYKSRFLHLGRL